MTTRADFLIAGGAALVGFAGAGGVGTMVLAADAPAAKVTTLGSWLRMLPDGTVEHFSDKVEVGMGVSTGLAQLIADELDVPFARVKMLLGDTAGCPDQGGVGGSTTTFMGNFPVRHVAAQMRRVLVDAAGQKLGVPPSGLVVTNGVVSAKDDPSKAIAYRDLIAALATDLTLPLTGDGPSTDVKVAVEPKAWAQYELAGSPVPRVDAAPKAFGRYPYVVDVKLPQMLHGRVVYPPGIGRTLAAVDESSIRGIGDARVVRVKDFVAVVASREWDAVKAARNLKVSWSAPNVGLPAMDSLADYMWAQSPFKQHAVAAVGDSDAMLASGALEAQYFFPFQSHANMGPGCSVVDVKPDLVTVWSGTQKVHALRRGIADLLDLPVTKVRVRWASDAGSYGRGGLEESAGAAALLSRAVGKPVRVQSMRADNTGWGTKGPAMVAKLRGKVQDGGILAFESVVRQFNGNEIYSRPDSAGGFIAGQLAGRVNEGKTFEFGEYGSQSAKYEIPNLKGSAELIAPFAPGNSPLRTAHLRDPQGPGTTFFIESFIDELAARAGADAVAFRLRHLSNPRHVETVQAAAKAAHWVTRPSGSQPGNAPGGELLGRGIAFATRGPTIVATVADVAVDPKTGKVSVRRVVCAHDCGFIVNPKSLQGTIEANVIQSVSRSLYEEATFDSSRVTSVDWRTYPVLRMKEAPEVVAVMLHRPTIAPGGAGEPSSRPTTAAIGNAIFDATGVRVRTAPFTPKNVLTALKAAGRV